MAKVLSPSKSFKGWKFGEWFKGNWVTLKELLKVGLPLVLGWLATSNPLWTVVVTVLGKLALDSGEYYFKELTK